MVLAEEASELDVAAGPHPVLDRATAAFKTLLARGGRFAKDVRGVGVDVPGPVELATGRVISPPIMTGWDEFDIPGYFAEHFDCPTLVENDVNAMAFGEQRTCWPQHLHMLMIKVGTGVGCGIIANGEIHRGAQGAAGDLGHIPYSGEAGPVCRCGNIGCVEAYAGGWALLRDLRALGHDVQSSFDVVRLIRAGQPDAMRLARQAGRVLGQAISDAVSFFNPAPAVALVSVCGFGAVASSFSANAGALCKRGSGGRRSLSRRAIGDRGVSASCLAAVLLKILNIPHKPICVVIVSASNPITNLKILPTCTSLVSCVTSIFLI